MPKVIVRTQEDKLLKPNFSSVCKKISQQRHIIVTNRKAIKDKVNMILTLIIGIILLLTFHFYKKFSYFRNKGLTEDPGYFPLGSSVIWKMAFGSISIRHMTEELYINVFDIQSCKFCVKFSDPLFSGTKDAVFRYNLDSAKIQS